MAQRFGPINSRHGHRRLNVLFSRARAGMALFTSFGADDVRPAETSNPGCGSSSSISSMSKRGAARRAARPAVRPKSAFEMDLGERLRAHGYEVEARVGVSGARIDLGVLHPDHPGHFLAGIESDGPRFPRQPKRARSRPPARAGAAGSRVDHPSGLVDRLVRRPGRRNREAGAAAGRAAPAPGPHAGGSGRVDGRGGLDNIAGRRSSTAWSDGNGMVLVPKPQTITIRPGGRRWISTAATRSPRLEAFALLAAFRERVIRPANRRTSSRIRSILRDAMIETIVRQRLRHADEWFVKVPLYQRSGTSPAERRLYLDRIAAIIDRIAEGPLSSTRDLSEQPPNGSIPLTRMGQPQPPKSCRRAGVQAGNGGAEGHSGAAAR